MLIYRHPASTSYAPNWALWTKDVVPTSLKPTFNHADRNYFITKDVGAGIVVDAEYATYSAAAARWVALCNSSAANAYLGGALRGDVAALNINTHKIVNGIITSRS
tara:strand:- start:540 stop:857 length:318 start_codon:yes stop_codon:yes gene_type:complete